MNTELKALMADIEAKAQANKEARQIKVLQTDKGTSRHLRKLDTDKLNNIVTTLSGITDRPIFTGYTFAKNVETLVAIASTLQYMKGDLREEVPSVLWTIFDGDTRTELLTAYGRLPYLADDVTIEINGETVTVDPEAKERAEKGEPANVEDLESIVNDLALQLNLLGEYKCTQQEADKAWAIAKNKMRKDSTLADYKESLLK